MKSWVRNLAVICFFIILVIPSLATSQLKEEELRTQGWSNGKEWERLDVQSKNCYLSGIEDGIFF
jgi:hypothetical protein